MADLLRDLLDRFNDGDDSFMSYFNDDSELFFDILNKKNMLDEVNLDRLDDEFQNKLIKFFASDNIEKFNYWVQQFIGYISIENGKYYLTIEDRGDLSRLFCKGRNDISQDMIEQVLNGEYNADFYGLDCNVYDDVIDNLDKKNLIHLGNYIIKHLDGVNIDPETELLENISQSQSHPEYAIINQENISEVINDKETMEFLLSDKLRELESELNSVYGNSYEHAYESELYDNIWDELQTYFVGTGEWVRAPGKYNRKTTVDALKIEIRDFIRDIIYYIDNTSASLAYYGSYIDILRDRSDCLSVYSPDYPDSDDVTKNINEYLGDYI
jgi:hypothetical protein